MLQETADTLGFCRELAHSGQPSSVGRDRAGLGAIRTLSTLTSLQLVKCSPNSTARTRLQKELDFLKFRYPNGGEWLEKTVRASSSDVECFFVITAYGEHAGAIISKKKSVLERKISTFYIAPRFRRRGFGNLAMRTLLERFFDDNVDRVYITHCRQELPGFGGFLQGVAYWDECEVPDLYFRGKTEVISAIYPSAIHSQIDIEKNGADWCF